MMARLGSLLVPKNADDSLFVIVDSNDDTWGNRWFTIWDVQTGDERVYPEQGLLASFEVDDG